jgi:multiple sugar transport system permease protein
MEQRAATPVSPLVAARKERWAGRTLLGLAFCSPLILIFLLLVITPIFYMIYLGTDWSIYPAIFSDPVFIQTLWNTVIFVGVGVNVKMFLALVLSALFSIEHPLAKIVAGLFLLPWAIPALPGILTFRWMLNGQWGIVNGVLNKLGFAGYPWLVRRPTALGAAIVYHVWKYLPFWTLIFVAGRRNLYLICSLLSMVFTLGDFVVVRIMTGGAPGDSTHVLATLAYRYTFQMGRIDWGVGTFVTALPITLLFIFILIRWVK